MTLEHRTDCRIPGRRRGERRGRAFPLLHRDGTVHDEGRIIAVVTRSANGSKRRTRNTDTFCRWSTRKTHGNEVTVRARLTGEFLGVPLNWTTSSTLQTTRCFAGDSI